MINWPNPDNMPLPEQPPDRPLQWIIDLMELWSEFRLQPGEGRKEIEAYESIPEPQPHPEFIWERAVWYLAIQRVTGNTMPVYLKTFLAESYWKTDWREQAGKDENVRKALKPIIKKVEEQDKISEAFRRDAETKAKYGL